MPICEQPGQLELEKSIELESSFGLIVGLTFLKSKSYHPKLAQKSKTYLFSKILRKITAERARL